MGELAAALLIVGRVLLGAAFVIFGLRNILAVERLTGVQAKRGLPRPRLVIMAGIGMQLVGGALVASGWFAAVGAALLIVFLFVAAYLFHSPWEFPAGERTPHVNAWIMNTGLAGAFLMVLALSI